jgi:hypothetical protein
MKQLTLSGCDRRDDLIDEIRRSKMYRVCWLMCVCGKVMISLAHSQTSDR